MNPKRLTIAAALLLLPGAPASAHRLDEYLQATLLSIEKDRVQATMRLVPGVAVSSFILASIDANADGALSKAERQAYAERVLRDVSLTIDGAILKPRLISVEFPDVEGMKEGLGEIHIEFSADLPRSGPNRRLVFENHHQSRIAAYLVNCLVPRDHDIRVLAQNRNELQSFYQLDYVEARVPSNTLPLKWLGLLAILLFARLTFLRRPLAVLCLLAVLAQASEVQEVNNRFVKQLSARIAGHEKEPAQKVFKNIQLPWFKNTPAAVLIDIMNGGYSRALGVACTHCHVALDFASDAKREKRAAREMAIMHWEINQQLAKMQNIEGKPEERYINCATCHRGEIDPRLKGQ